jgi:hypothetical protein
MVDRQVQRDRTADAEAENNNLADVQVSKQSDIGC